MRTRRQSTLNSKPPKDMEADPRISDVEVDELAMSEAPKRRKLVHGADRSSSPDMPEPHDSSTHPVNLYLLPKPFKNPHFHGTSKKIRSVKQIIASLSSLSPGVPTWTSIQAAPSIRPLPKYCDITGLPSSYTDPATGLHFYNAEVYQHIKALSSTMVQRYLAIRNRAVVI